MVILFTPHPNRRQAVAGESPIDRAGGGRERLGEKRSGQSKGTPHRLAASVRGRSRVAMGSPSRIASSRYAASYAERLCSLASDRIPSIALAGVVSSTWIGKVLNSSTNRRDCASVRRRLRSAASSTFATSRGHTAGTLAPSPARRASTDSVYGAASSSKHQA